MDFKHRILPFYMTYPEVRSPYSQQDNMRDLEYLQQMYPLEVRRYQRRVAEILDRMDYEGSMIYDEYPDRFSLERMAKNIVTILQREEREAAVENPTPPEKWVWLQDLILVLLYNEVYKRRHGGSIK